jgi:hypothetical protein
MVVAVAAAAAAIVKPPEEEGQDSFFPIDTEAFAAIVEEITSKTGQRIILENARLVAEYLSHGRVFGPRQYQLIGKQIPNRPFPCPMIRGNEFALWLEPGTSFNALTALFKKYFNHPDPVQKDEIFPELAMPTLTPGWHIITVKPKEGVSVRKDTFDSPSYLVAAAGAQMAMALGRPLNFGGVRCAEGNSPVIIQDPQTHGVTYSTAYNKQHAAEESLLAGRYDETFQQWVPSSPQPCYGYQGPAQSTGLQLFKSIQHRPYREFWRRLCLEDPGVAKHTLQHLGKQESMSATNARIEADPALLKKAPSEAFFRGDLPSCRVSFVETDTLTTREILLRQFIQDGNIQELKRRSSHAFLAIADLLWNADGGTLDQAVRDLTQYPHWTKRFTYEDIAQRMNRTQMTPYGTLKNRTPGIDLPPQYPLWLHDDAEQNARDAEVAGLRDELQPKTWKNTARTAILSERLKDLGFNKWVQLGTFLFNNPKFSHLLPFGQNVQVEQQEGVYLLKFSSIPFHNYTRAIRSIFTNKKLTREDFPRRFEDLPTSVQVITQEDLRRSANQTATVKIGNRTLLIQEPMILLAQLPKPRDKTVSFPGRMSCEQANLHWRKPPPNPYWDWRGPKHRHEPELTADEALDRLFRGNWKNSNWPKTPSAPEPLPLWDLFDILRKKDPKRWVQLGTILLNTPRFAACLKVDPNFCPKTVNGFSIIEGGINLTYYRHLLETVFDDVYSTDHLLDVGRAFAQAAQHVQVISQEDLSTPATKSVKVLFGDHSLEITQPSIILTLPPRAFEFAKKVELEPAPLSPHRQAAMAKRPASAAAAAANQQKQPTRAERVRSSSKAKAAAAAAQKTRDPLKGFLTELASHGPQRHILSQYYQELLKKNPYQARQLSIVTLLGKNWSDAETIITDRECSRLLVKAHQTMAATPDAFKTLGISHACVRDRMAHVLVCQESDIQTDHGAAIRLDGRIQIMRTPFILLNHTRIFEPQEEPPQLVPLNTYPDKTIPDYMLGKPPKPEDKR